jgi:hypothetical protein
MGRVVQLETGAGFWPCAGHGTTWPGQGFPGEALLPELDKSILSFFLFFKAKVLLLLCHSETSFYF